MKKKLIRLTESDLHNIVKESVNRILKEHDDDDPDYGPLGDAEYYATHDFAADAARECSIWYWIDPSTNNIMNEDDADDSCIDFRILPKFYDCGDCYEIEDIDFEFYGNNSDELYRRFGQIVSDFIDKNYDALCNEIKKDSPYAIY